MTNNKEWERRSDLWVKATHESRIKKEKRFAEEEKRKTEKESATPPKQKK